MQPRTIAIFLSEDELLHISMKLLPFYFLLSTLHAIEFSNFPHMRKYFPALPFAISRNKKFNSYREIYVGKNFHPGIACAFEHDGYNDEMKYLPALFLLLCLGACGPKEIGQGTSDEPSGSGNYSVAEQMRQPMTGANYTQRMLYYYNRPDVMENVRNWRVSEFQRQMGISPEDPAYRAVPKQSSPFRE